MKGDHPRSLDGVEVISRVNTQTSVKSRLSRVATNLTSKSRKARLQPARIPTSDLDNGIVGWESQSDPEMPKNFPESRKWFLISLLASITFISPLASSIFAPAVPFMVCGSTSYLGRLTSHGSLVMFRELIPLTQRL